MIEAYTVLSLTYVIRHTLTKNIIIKLHTNVPGSWRFHEVHAHTLSIVTDVDLLT